MTMTVKLTDRMQCIADYIEKNQRVVDVGTDHGLVPIYLVQKEITGDVILSDIGEGPLANAADNIKKSGIDENMMDIRCGSGLETVSEEEVDVAIIAGMGGNLIIEILQADIKKSRSMEFVLQPRKKQERLVYWLYNNGFTIVDEKLVKESYYVWQVMKVKPIKDVKIKKYPCDFSINPILLENKDPLLKDFLEQKLKIEKKINNGSKMGKTWTSRLNYERSKILVEYMSELITKL